MNSRTLGIAGCAGAILACFSGAHAQTFGPDPNRVDWGTVAVGKNSKITRQSFSVIENPAQLQDYYRQVKGNGAMPTFSIDWVRYKVVGITTQPRPSGSSVFVRSVDKQINGNSIVTAVEKVGRAREGSLEQSSWAIIRVERSALNIDVNFTTIQGNSFGGGGAADWRTWLMPNAPLFGYSVLHQGQYCRLRTNGILLARNFAEQQELVTQMFNQGQVPNLPNIDYNRHQLVAVLLGQRPSGNYSVRIEAIGRGREGGSLVIASESASWGGLATMALTQPYVLLAVDRLATNLSVCWL
jgi:hypothetical protein